ncbi:MAG: ATP-binding cassette domain-containing protein [Alphaproteobacteria bacterium]|nr:ATP-binding cassette domain-containing protein [Alphaproteobacteria bacterium]
MSSSRPPTTPPAAGSPHELERRVGGSEKPGNRGGRGGRRRSQRCRATRQRGAFIVGVWVRASRADDLPAISASLRVLRGSLCFLSTNATGDVVSTAPILEARNLARVFAVRRSGGLFGRPAQLHAVDDVSFDLAPGETLGLVGESGCGKSTTAKLVLGLLAPSAGEIRFEGAAVPAPGTAAWRALRRRMQMVFQDPMGALDRRLPVGAQVMEPLAIHGLGEAGARRERAQALLEAVGLGAHHFDRYPHELSGGQRQRIVLARAMILEPSLLVCDEPISALDVSIQAQVINLLLDLQEKYRLAYLFISHDLKVVRQISHRVAVMYLGRIVEEGDPDEILAEPAHPYSQALVSAIPVAAAARRRPRLILKGDPPNPVDRPPGCAFHTRCPVATARCRDDVPVLKALGGTRRVACHVAHGEGGSA